MPALQSVLGTWCSLLCLPWNSSAQCDHTDGGLCHQEVTQELGLTTYPHEHSVPISRCSLSSLPPEQSRVASLWFVPTQFSLSRNAGTSGRLLFCPLLSQGLLASVFPRFPKAGHTLASGVFSRGSCSLSCFTLSFPESRVEWA